MKLIKQVNFKILCVLFVTVIAGCASAQPVGKDKYYHFGADAGGGMVSEYVGHELDLPSGSAFVAGFAKETFDYIKYGKFDALDLAATTLGGIVVNIIIKKIKKKK
jgi:poly(3-hydroxybutyrate) depolymerase